MPRQSPTHQTEHKFLRLFRIPTVGGADSSRHLAPSKSVDRNSGGDSQQSRRQVHLGRFKQAIRPPRPGNFTQSGATTSDEMGNVHQVGFTSPI